MQLPIVFLAIVSAVSAAPQLFFVVPQQFLDNPSQQNFQNFIPLIVPFTPQQSEAAPVNQDAPVAVEEALTQTLGNEITSEVTAEAAAPEHIADVAAVAAEEPAVVAAEEPAAAIVPEVVAEPQANIEEIAVEQAPTENEIIPTKQVIETVQESVTPTEVVSEPVNTQEPAVEIPLEVTFYGQEAIPKTEVIADVVPEPSTVAVESPEVQTDLLTAVETVETPKPEENLQADINSGKSFNSIASPNTIHHSIVTHFGFRDAASVKSQPITFTHHGAVVDPKTLVPMQFRHFIYQNDSPDVVAAKIAFFRVQAALTPAKAAKLL